MAAATGIGTRKALQFRARRRHVERQAIGRRDRVDHTGIEVLGVPHHVPDSLVFLRMNTVRQILDGLHDTPDRLEGANQLLGLRHPLRHLAGRPPAFDGRYELLNDRLFARIILEQVARFLDELQRIGQGIIVLRSKAASADSHLVKNTAQVVDDF